MKRQAWLFGLLAVLIVVGMSSCDLRGIIGRTAESTTVMGGIPAEVVEKDGKLYLIVEGTTLYSKGLAYDETAPIEADTAIAVITKDDKVYYYDPVLGDVSDTGLSDETNRIVVTYMLFADDIADEAVSPSIKALQGELPEGQTATGCTITQVDTNTYSVRNDKKRWVAINYTVNSDNVIEFLNPRGNLIEVSLYDAITEGVGSLFSFAEKDSVELPIPDSSLVIHGSVFKALPEIITDKLLPLPDRYQYHNELDMAIEQDLGTVGALLALEFVDAVAMAINTTASILDMEQVVKPITQATVHSLVEIFQAFMTEVIMNQQPVEGTTNALIDVLGEEFIDAVFRQASSKNLQVEPSNTEARSVAAVVAAGYKILKTILTIVNLLDWAVVGKLDTLTTSPYEAIGNGTPLITEQDFTGDGTLDLRVDNGIMWIQINRDPILQGIKGFIDAGGISGQGNYLGMHIASGGMVDQTAYWETNAFSVQIISNTSQIGSYKVTCVDAANGKEVIKEFTVTLEASKEYALIDYLFTNTCFSSWTHDFPPSYIHDGADLVDVKSAELYDIDAYINGVGVIDLTSLTWWKSYTPDQNSPFFVLYRPSTGDGVTFGFKHLWDYPIHQVVAYYTGTSPGISPHLGIMATEFTLSPNASAQWKALISFHKDGYSKGIEIYNGATQ